MENIQVVKIKEIKNNNLQISLCFTSEKIGTFIVKGFRVGPSPKYDGIWVQPPSIPIYGRYHPVFFLENKEQWKSLATYLPEVYKEHQKEKESDITEDDYKEISDEPLEPF